MIGYLSYWQFAILSVFAFMFLALAARVLRDAMKLNRPKTVEQEDAECRGVVAHIGQHHPSIGTIDDDDQFDDPVAEIVHGIDITRIASGL